METGLDIGVCVEDDVCVAVDCGVGVTEPSKAAESGIRRAGMGVGVTEPCKSVRLCATRLASHISPTIETNPATSANIITRANGFRFVEALLCITAIKRSR